jgi:hypothetical protein
VWVGEGGGGSSRWPVPASDCLVMMLGIQGLEEKAEKSGQKVRVLWLWVRGCVRADWGGGQAGECML